MYCSLLHPQLALTWRLGDGGSQVHPKSAKPYMTYSLNSLEGGYIREYIGDYYRVIMGDYYRVIKGDTRSLDHGSHGGFQIPVIRMIVLGSTLGSLKSWRLPYTATNSIYKP